MLKYCLIILYSDICPCLYVVCVLYVHLHMYLHCNMHIGPRPQIAIKIIIYILYPHILQYSTRIRSYLTWIRFYHTRLQLESYDYKMISRQSISHYTTSFFFHQFIPNKPFYMVQQNT